MQAAHAGYPDDLYKMISEEELKFWSEYRIKGLGDFYTEFGAECPASLAYPQGY